MFIRSLRAALVLTTVLLLVFSCAVAQETTAGLQGTVKDPTSAVVARATVEVSGPALIGSKKVETDASGYYRFSNLPPGTYTITASAANFRTIKLENITLATGKLPTIDVTLQVGTATETVEVSGAAPLVDVTQSKIQTNVTEDVLASMPKGRSFQSVIPFAPGARQEPLTSAAGNRSGGYQIDGASDGENIYMSEGMDVTNIQDGGVGKDVPMEFVQEVQIKSGGFEAEYGGALGGVVNVVQKRGGNTWHGSVFTYFRSDALNANDQCAWFGACGLRSNPATSFSSSARRDAAQQYYIQKKDHQRILDPGVEIGGYLKKDKLWLFTSYVPSIDRLSRTVNFVSPWNQRTFNRAIDTHNGMLRLDWMATSKIRTYGAWQYGYVRQTGIDLPNPDSVFGQTNTTAGNDPSSYRADRGNVSPSSVYTFGSDISVTNKFVVSTRFGYWFTNFEDRGRFSNTRYQYIANAVGVVGLDGTALPSQYQRTTGWQNISSTLGAYFDAYKRHSFSTDGSYYAKFGGTHNFKLGYAFNRLANNVLRAFNGPYVRLVWGQSYDPLDPSACGIAGKPACQGNFGYYIIRDGVDNQGNVASFNHALYAQDNWTLGRGVTLNLGIRFDKEYLPPFQKGAPAVDFGWTKKVAPRLGGAWDVLNNGKVKLYGSFGYFYDIMKYSLPRGSFGGDYWHDCAYTLDNPDYTAIQPTLVNAHTCPAGGSTVPANGVTTGQFIENVNFRSVILYPSDPGIDPNIHPMMQHETAFGGDWAINPNLGLEVRYTRKRLDYTIEDVGVAVPGNELYYIGNPGYGIVKNLLQRVTVDSSTLPFRPVTEYAAQCTDCPLSPKAYRNYDGLEVRLTKRASSRWFGTLSYTYSRLYGNYGGLTSSDISDGGGGRHSPNNSRYFDMPNMAWTALGKPDFGPLGTDRPHTLKLFGFYRLKWWNQETLLGFSQLAYSGTPLSTCWPQVSTTSSCQYVAGRASWVQLSQTPGQDIQLVGVKHDYRTPAFTQTDFNFSHELKVSKTNEAMRLVFNANIINLFNQHAVMALLDTPFASTQISTPRIGGGPTGATDWHAMTDKGYDYVATANLSNVATGGSVYGRTLSNLYGKPNLFQGARTMRLQIKFTF